MAKKCVLCEGKCGRILKYELKDGIFCFNCNLELEKLGLIDEKTWYPKMFTSQQVKDILSNPEGKKEEILEICKDYAMKQKENENCLICGTKTGITTGKYKTSDGRALCVKCMYNAITISPHEFLKEKDKYIERHDSQFFKENMGKVEYPHPALLVNYSKQRLYYYGEWIDKIENVFSFDAIVKIESDVQTYEVTVGKSGHPIARAIVGNAVFGTTGAVIGAMTAKNTKHKETRDGKKYICIYHKDFLEPNKIHKRMLYCNDDTEIVKVEACLKRIIEFSDEPKSTQSEGVLSTTQRKADEKNDYQELIELKNLLDMGIITQEDFNMKKREILGL